MHPNRLGSQKASICSKIKIHCHYHWLLSPPSLSTTFTESSLLTCSFRHSPPGLDELPLDQFHSIHGWKHPSCSCLYFLYSHSFYSSFRLWELSPVLQCWSLSLSPSVGRRRFYGDIQDIHQCVYGRRPVQAPSPLLLTDLVGDIPLDTWEPF